jgi:serine/threonine protein kinase
MTYARKIIPLEKTAAKVSAEVEILKQLRHQHIINLAAYCTTSDQLWLFTTPVAEGNLATYLHNNSNFSFGLPDRELLRTWESDIISALKYLHGREILHGDIKPQNMLVSSDMKIYLSDFGSARAKYVEPSHGTEPQPASALTPKYSAPEVFYHKSVGYSWEMGAAADIFSLGCVWAEIETVYAGLPILVFETFRSGGSSYNSFQANLPKTYIWLDFLWVLQESSWQTSRLWGYGPSTLQKTRDMLSFDPQQRPNTDQLTTKLHSTGDFNTGAHRDRNVSCGRRLSKPISKGCVFGWTDDLVAKQINTAFKAKPFNVRKAPTEGFSPNGCIDASYNWDTSTPPKGLSLGLEGRATSAAPVFFEPLSNVPITLEAADGDRATHDMILRKDFLQVKRTSSGSSRSNIFQMYHSVALHEARSPFEARIMHVKDLAKSQYLQQYWKIPKGFDFESTSGSGSLNGDLQVDGDLKVNGDVRVNGELQANGDLWIVESLSDYLRKTSPPSSAEDTVNLWDSAAEIFKWVDLQIDELSYESLSRRSATYANYFSHYKVPVRHGHITLENIFVYRSKTESPYVGRWKIGDFGISPMKVQEEVLKGMHIFGVFRIYANMLLQMMATAMACRISMEQTATYHSKKYGLQQ